MLAQVTTTTIASPTSPITVVVEAPFDWLGLTISVLLGMAAIGVAAWAVSTSKRIAKEQTNLQAMQVSLEQRQTEIANIQSVTSMELQRIEKKQHKWQIKDRGSALLEVTRHNVDITTGRSGGVDHSVRRYVRIRNAGQSVAEDVSWQLQHGDPADVIPDQVPQSFDSIHPGEHVDLLMHEPRMDSPQFVVFTVVWHDEFSGTQVQRTTRKLNRD